MTQQPLYDAPGTKPKKKGEQKQQQVDTDQRPYVRHHYERVRLPTHNGSETRTKQSFKDDCDINLIVKRHASTGLWSHLANRTPLYGDFTQATELQDAIEKVNAAEDEFFVLPAAVRAACNNNPVQFYNMMGAEEAVRLLADAGLPMSAEWQATEKKRAAAEKEKEKAALDQKISEHYPEGIPGLKPDPGTT